MERQLNFMTDATDFDSAACELAEIGLTDDQIELVWSWHRITCVQQAQSAGGVVIVRLLSYLLDGHKDGSLPVRVAAIAYGTGLRNLVQHKSVEECAEALGVSRQALESAAKQAKKALLG